MSGDPRVMSAHRPRIGRADFSPLLRDKPKQRTEVRSTWVPEGAADSAVELLQTQFELGIGCGQMLAGGGDTPARTVTGQRFDGMQ
jgi:hypothetical protein